MLKRYLVTSLICSGFSLNIERGKFRSLSSLNRIFHQVGPEFIMLTVFSDNLAKGEHPLASKEHSSIE